ncbi:MAG: amidotransferase, partial [Pseudomonadota bacterium]
MALIAIVDYGMGNIHSVARALRHAAPEADIRLCSRAQDLKAAERVVFPGQGAMADCIRTLNDAGLREAVLEAAKNKPLLGVCVGEQMLFERSEEGNTTSLGVFKGEVKRFQGPPFYAGPQQLKVPHMGWNPVKQSRAHALWQGSPDLTPFYFVHS